MLRPANRRHRRQCRPSSLHPAPRRPSRLRSRRRRPCCARQSTRNLPGAGPALPARVFSVARLALTARQSAHRQSYAHRPRKPALHHRSSPFDHGPRPLRQNTRKVASSQGDHCGQATVNRELPTGTGWLRNQCLEPRLLAHMVEIGIAVRFLDHPRAAARDRCF